MSSDSPTVAGDAAHPVTHDAACVDHLDLRTTRQHRPHKAAGARAFWLVAFAFTVLLLGTTVPTPLYVVYQADWGFSAGVLTLIFAVYSAGVLTALLLCGRLSDEIGRTRVLLAAVAVAASSTLVFLFASGIAMLFVARALSGFAAGIAQGTATAALAELEPGHNVRRAALTGSAVTSGAVGLGPLLTGLLAEYAGWRTHLVFVVYLVLLALAAAAVLLVPETVENRHRPSLRVQRLAVPAAIRAEFLSAALAMFAAFALVGLFVSLVPSFLGRELNETSHAAAGIVVFTLFAFATGAQLALHGLLSRRAMLIGFGWLMAGLLLVMLGLAVKELWVFVLGTIACGIGVGLVIMGALAMVNRIAPPDHRGETLSSLFVAAYVGMSVPAIGVGLASEQFGFFRSTLVCSIGVALLLVAAAVRLTSRRLGPSTAPAAP
jgi:MFS family permease